MWKDTCVDSENLMAMRLRLLIEQLGEELHFQRGWPVRVAERTGISEQMVRKIYSGERQGSIGSAQAASQQMGIDEAFFWSDFPEPPHYSAHLKRTSALRSFVDVRDIEASLREGNPYSGWWQFVKDDEKLGFEMSAAERACLEAIRLPPGKDPEPQWYLGMLNSIRMIPTTRTVSPRSLPRATDSDDSEPGIKR